MHIERFSEIRQDCLLASTGQADVRTKLGLHHIAVTGGTGFLGTWIAEMVAALNDDYRLGITLDLYARNINDWLQKYPHLANRDDINLKSQDVRSPFDFARNTHFVIHAAGLCQLRRLGARPQRRSPGAVAHL